MEIKQVCSLIYTCKLYYIDIIRNFTSRERARWNKNQSSGDNTLIKGLDIYFHTLKASFNCPKACGTTSVRLEEVSVTNNAFWLCNWYFMWCWLEASRQVNKKFQNFGKSRNKKSRTRHRTNLQNVSSSRFKPVVLPGYTAIDRSPLKLLQCNWCIPPLLLLLLRNRM